jgi:hypothetical protein
MLIANPIYDPAFKQLMENRRIAMFFIATLTGENVVDIAFVPQEYTYKKIKKEVKEIKNGVEEVRYEVYSTIRFDFVATIRTENGEHKKVFVEVQQANNPTNLMRFRTYLGKQYQTVDVVEVEGGKEEKGLPIISIYLLGFKLSDIKAAAIKVCRTYIDMIGQKEIKQKNELIEALTHDGYFVQIPHIEGKTRTALERLLSVFEQTSLRETKIDKDYDYPVEDENIKLMLEILKHAAADPKTRREMEEAWWAEEDEKAYEKMENKLKEKDKTIEEKEKTIEEIEKENAILREELLKYKQQK